MGTLKTKIETIVAEHFAGASTDLEIIRQSQKLSGSVVWDGWRGKTQTERQRQMGAMLRQRLSPAEQQYLSAILTMTPAEVNALRDHG